MGDRSVRYIKVCESLVLEGRASRRDVERDCCRGCRLGCALYIVCSRTAI